jgi:hypothetical protein
MNDTTKDKFLAEYPDWCLKPHKLTTAEMENPIEVLAEFFDAYSLQDIRIRLKDWLLDAFESEEASAKNHYWLLDYIERLIEAAYVIYQKRICD